MHQVVLIIGGNEGDRHALIQLAKSKLDYLFGPATLASSIYESSPWGGNSNGYYLNQVLNYQVVQSPLEILRSIQKIEIELGRERKQKWGNRTMDIDILYYDDQVVELPDLVIPHPYLHLRSFVLEPLVEILPLYLHPVLDKTNQELLMDLDTRH
jgi:2-amino-4-hydroxy-6-hydroxymethyldihydropteridine diphosphokinase